MVNKYMKQYLESLASRERQIKTTQGIIPLILEWLLSKSQKITTAGKVVGKIQYTVGVNPNQYNHYVFVIFYHGML